MNIKMTNMLHFASFLYHNKPFFLSGLDNFKKMQIMRNQNKTLIGWCIIKLHHENSFILKFQFEMITQQSV